VRPARLAARPWLEVGGLIVGLGLFVAVAILWPVRNQERFLRQAALSFAGALGLGAAAVLAARRAAATFSWVRSVGPLRFGLLAALVADMPLDSSNWDGFVEWVTPPAPWSRPRAVLRRSYWLGVGRARAPRGPAGEAARGRPGARRAAFNAPATAAVAAIRRRWAIPAPSRED
jgi:hypothetical protein